MKVNLNSLLNPYHKEFFQSSDEEIIFYGGAAGGKSFSAADKILLQPLIYKRSLKILVMRKSMPSLKRTCMPLLLQRASDMQIPFTLNRALNTLDLPYGSQVLFLSINNIDEIEKIKSITDADYAWIEEANELIEDAYSQVLLRLRGGKGPFKQAILTFNPIGQTNWIYERFFVRNIGNAKKIKVNVHQNPFIEQSYVKKLQALKNVNENLYNVYYLGDWGSLEGTVYTNYEIVTKAPKNVDDVIYGIDFGFNNPSAVVKIDLKDQVPYVEEKLYETNLTNQELIQKMKSMGITSELIYADSAEPDRIQEMNDAGFNVMPAKKTDVKTMIDFVKTLPLKIIDGSENLIKELQSYCWERNNAGEYIDKPVKFRDHCMDAMRYPLWTHLRHRFEFIAIGAEGAIDNSMAGIFQELKIRQAFGL